MPEVAMDVGSAEGDIAMGVFSTVWGHPLRSMNGGCDFTAPPRRLGIGGPGLSHIRRTVNPRRASVANAHHRSTQFHLAFSRIGFSPAEHILRSIMQDSPINSGGVTAPYGQFHPAGIPSAQSVACVALG